MSTYKKVIGVVGAGYGDEGKGKTVSYLCQKHQHEKRIVVRFNGGSQAAHNVVLENGTHHTFSHFGSGTLQGVPTYFNDQFIMNPLLYVAERKNLVNKISTIPPLFFHTDCRVSTPYDMLYNLALESSRGLYKHGSCGVGIFTTITRYNEIEGSPTIGELCHDPKLIFPFLETVKAYYLEKMYALNNAGEYIDLLNNTQVEQPFHDAIVGMECQLVDDIDMIKKFNTFIFEGAQGLMLSEKHGIAPYLTPSDPGSTEIVKFANQINALSKKCSLQLYYVSRAYTTRHGAGPLANECTAGELEICTKDEKNTTNQNQDYFRYAPLDLPMLINTIMTDLTLSMMSIVNEIKIIPMVLVINGFDQIKNPESMIDEILAFINTNYMNVNIIMGVGPKSSYMIELDKQKPANVGASLVNKMGCITGE